MSLLSESLSLQDKNDQISSRVLEWLLIVIKMNRRYFYATFWSFAEAGIDEFREARFSAGSSEVTSVGRLQPRVGGEKIVYYFGGIWAPSIV